MDITESVDSDSPMLDQDASDYEKLAKSEPTISNWKKYLETITVDDDQHDPELALNTFVRALYETKYDVPASHIIWNMFVDYMTKKMDADEGSVENEISILQKGFYDTISTPHLEIDSTFNNYSCFVSKYLPKDVYIQEMAEMSKIKNETCKLIQRLEPWESQIANDETNINIWIEYLEFLAKMKKVDRVIKTGLLKRAFQRAITAFKEDTTDSSIQIWLKYISLDVEFDLDNLYTRLIQRFPFNGFAWSKFIRSQSSIGNLETCGVSEVLISMEDHVQFTSLSLTLLRKDFSFLEQDTDKSVGLLLSHIGLIFPKAVTFNGVFHSVEKLCIEIYDTLGLIDNAKELITQMITDEVCNTQVEVWLFAIEFEKKHGDHDSVVELFKQGIKNSLNIDWPQRLIQEWKRYEYLNGSDEDLEFFEKLSQQIEAQLRQQEAERAAEQDMEETPGPAETGKRSRDENERELIKLKKAKVKTLSTPIRDRENLTILVSNIPETVDKSTIGKLFQDCGTIRTLLKFDDKATLEFTEERDLLAALTKDHKIINGAEIRVNHLRNNTVWVTNFPPKYDQAALNELFGSVGQILSVRLPSLKSNANRRFCYIEYTSSESALGAVTAFDGEQLTDSATNKNYKLIVKISNPQEKNARTGAVEEGREVYVSRLDFYKVSEDIIRSEFSKYGEIESVKLPLSKRNEKMKRINDGYGFVSFTKKEDAENAVNNLNGFEFFNRPIAAAVAEPKARRTATIDNSSNFPNSVKYISKSETNSKTISILNLDDRINDSQLLSILQQVGPIRKLQLRPDLNGALVEFVNISDCGKAEIKFNGFKIGNSEVSVGSKFDLEKQGKKMVGKYNASTPVVAELPKEQKSSKPVADATLNEENKVIKPKSNDDFRAMFLKR